MSKKNILLLGGYGFLGTNIIKYIDDKLNGEYEVIVFDKFSKHPAGVEFECVSRSYSGDFSDTKLINSIFDDNIIDLVIHCISTTVPASAFNARYDIETNLIPTIGLLNCMIKHRVHDIVYISSGGAVYGNASQTAHKEDDDVFPVSSYGVVKLAIEKYMMQYSELHGLNPLILRLSNPYGPWHYSMKQGICNIAIKNAIEGATFTVWGDGNGTKDYIFVEDFTDILFRLISTKLSPIVINIGSGNCFSVNDVLLAVKDLCPSFCWEYSNASELDVSKFSLNTDKLKTLIGEYSFTSLAEGLEKTLIWTKKECCN